MITKQSFRAALLACAGFAALGLVAGASPAAAKTKTATTTVCTPVSVAVPTDAHSHATVPFSLGKLPKGATILDVNPQIRITQQRAYMNVLVASPSGRMALLGNGDSQAATTTDDWGTGPACAGTPTTFDDQASTTFFNSSPPNAGTFSPLSPLSNLNGGPAAGTWRFFVDDLNNNPARPATVNSVGATVVYQYRVKKKKKKKSKKSAAEISKKKKQKLGPPRFGSTDSCVNANLVVNNGPNDPPTSDRATLGAVPIATANLPRGATVTDVDARVRMTHTFEGDVEFYLASPTGVIVPLWIGNNEDGDDFGTGAPDCTGTPTVFDDEAGTSILDGTSPYAGSFKPITPLSALDGSLAGGTWTLYVEDHYTGDRGVLHSAGLKIDYSYRGKVKQKKHKK